MLRRGLVVAEIALSLVLLVCAGLLIGSIKRLGVIYSEFEPNIAVAVAISLPYSSAISAAPGESSAVTQAINRLSEVRTKIKATAGVQSVGAINDLPVTGGSSVNGGFSIEGKPSTNPGEGPVAEFRQV